LFVRRVGQESVRGGIVLPESAKVPGLPTFDGLGLGLVTGSGAK
jgi:hypothetical protein